jgi:hypothetical protein
MAASMPEWWRRCQVQEALAVAAWAARALSPELGRQASGRSSLMRWAFSGLWKPRSNETRVRSGWADFSRAVGHDGGVDDETGGVLADQDAVAEFDGGASLSAIDQFGVGLENAEQPIGQRDVMAQSQALARHMGAGR